MVVTVKNSLIMVVGMAEKAIGLYIERHILRPFAKSVIVLSLV